MLKEIIANNKLEWYEMDKLEVCDLEIQKIINQLDEIAYRYEQKWGIGILQKNCSVALKQKWDMQCEKFEAAILEKSVDNIRALASGFIRAYNALEEDVLRQGIEPPELGKNLSYMISEGKRLVICEKESDARFFKEMFKNETCAVWTVKEVAEYLNRAKVVFPTFEGHKTESTPLQPFDFAKGDEINF